ncbi:hypothetical protein ACIA8O_00420 [Kitasatospora sp. NPDC051853]|uniref:hypothetical protein n=1 Tax=Kitasatospora sp. NPDC051853 TaxID=3364058 RepID=UPI0037B6814B
MEHRPSWTTTARKLDQRVQLARDAAARIEAVLQQPSDDSPVTLKRRQATIASAVALRKAHEAAVLKAATLLLRRRAAGRPAPRRLPRGVLLPGGVTPRWWCEIVNQGDTGVWRLIPAPGPEEFVGLPADHRQC